MQRYYNDVVRSTWNVLNILYQKILGMTLMIKREFYKSRVDVGRAFVEAMTSSVPRKYSFV
jgi:hypothetical protein